MPSEVLPPPAAPPNKSWSALLKKPSSCGPSAFLPLDSAEHLPHPRRHGLLDDRLARPGDRSQGVDRNYLGQVGNEGEGLL